MKKKRYKIDEDLEFLRVILICLGIIVLIVIFTNTTNIDNAIKCNKIKGQYCSKYEIEKYTRGE